MPLSVVSYRYWVGSYNRELDGEQPRASPHNRESEGEAPFRFPFSLFLFDLS